MECVLRFAVEAQSTANVIIDTSGRRDMVHARLTTPSAFVRFVSCGIPEIDYARLDERIARIEKWRDERLHTVCFFVHQRFENGLPLFATYFIENLNQKLGLNLHVPHMAGERSMLF